MASAGNRCPLRAATLFTQAPEAFTTTGGLNDIPRCLYSRLSTVIEIHSYHGTILSNSRTIIFAPSPNPEVTPCGSAYPLLGSYAAPTTSPSWAHGAYREISSLSIHRVSTPRDCASSTFFFTPSRREASASTKYPVCMKPAWPPSEYSSNSSNANRDRQAI